MISNCAAATSPSSAATRASAATARASIGIYNTRAEVDTLVRGLRKVQEMFG